MRSGDTWIAALGVALVAAAACAHDLTRIVILTLGVLLVGAWWGSARLAALDDSDLAQLVGRSGSAAVTVTGPVRRTPFSLRVPATATAFGERAVDEPVLLEFPVGRSPPQGAILELDGRLRAPRGPDGGFDERAWLRRQGVHVVVRVESWRVVGRRGGVPGYADRVRAWLSRSLAPGVEGERRAVLAGIVLGEDEGLSQELRDRFRASGLYHLLAVSGQNVAFVAGGVLLLAWLLGVRRRLAELAALAAIASYVLAVGLQPSVVRAGIAGALASLAFLAGRERDRWHFLLVAAVVLLAWNPYNLLEPGFQLSFAAVAAIFVGVPRIERRLEGYPIHPKLGAVLALTAACSVATAPIAWLQFGAIPIYAIVANAVAAPVVAPLLGLGLVAAVLHPVLPGAAELVGAINGSLAAYLAGCARLVGGLPYATVATSAGLAALVAVLAAAILLLRLRGRARRTLLVALGCAAVLGLGWKLWPERAAFPPANGLRITFLDVGQGDATLLETRDAAVLVDQGPPEAKVAEQLRRRGVDRLSLLVLTHPQRDHIGGAADVMEMLDVDAVLDPGLAVDSHDEEDVIRAARRERARVLVARAGQSIAIGALRLDVLWPDGPGAAFEDPNENAIVIHARHGATDVLLTADAESHVTLPLRLPRVDILKLAHHGSADDRLDELLARTRPRFAVISCGAGNSYGHPAPSTVASLTRAAGLTVFRTDLDGRVAFEATGASLSVTTERG